MKQPNIRLWNNLIIFFTLYGIGNMILFFLLDLFSHHASFRLYPYDLILAGVSLFIGQWIFWRQAPIERQKKIKTAIGLVFLPIVCLLLFFIPSWLSSWPLGVLAISPLYLIALLIIQWLLWKRTTQTERATLKNILKWINISCSIPLLLFAAIYAISQYESNFTPERWQASPEERVLIVDDLLVEQQLKGMTQAQVTQLLGPPTQTNYFKEANNVVYYLGAERSFISIDSEWLVIEFDSQGKVNHVEIESD
jgi:outer membrane protein assembly factor BamE (lipoprotein component of BamABCDE complex)